MILLKMKKVTAFQEKVYETISEIPRGKVTTYKLVAEKIGCKSCQAVGQALKRNPYAPEVPCHRVISSSLKIGGFCGKSSGDKILKKIEMLRKEGVEFKGGKLKEKSLIYDFN